MRVVRMGLPVALVVGAAMGAGAQQVGLVAAPGVAGLADAGPGGAGLGGPFAGAAADTAPAARRRC